MSSITAAIRPRSASSSTASIRTRSAASGVFRSCPIAPSITSFSSSSAPTRRSMALCATIRRWISTGPSGSSCPAGARERAKASTCWVSAPSGRVMRRRISATVPTSTRYMSKVCSTSDSTTPRSVRGASRRAVSQVPSLRSMAAMMRRGRAEPGGRMNPRRASHAEITGSRAGSRSATNRRAASTPCASRTSCRACSISGRRRSPACWGARASSCTRSGRGMRKPISGASPRRECRSRGWPRMGAGIAPEQAEGRIVYKASQIPFALHAPHQCGGKPLCDQQCQRDGKQHLPLQTARPPEGKTQGFPVFRQSITHPQGL